MSAPMGTSATSASSGDVVGLNRYVSLDRYVSLNRFVIHVSCGHISFGHVSFSGEVDGHVDGDVNNGNGRMAKS